MTTIDRGTLTFDSVAASRFINNLFANQPDGYVQLMSINNKTKRNTVKFESVDSREKLVAKAEVLNRTADVYVGMAPRLSELDNGRRGGVNDCVGITSLWVDIDVAGEAHRADKSRLAPTMEAALEVLGAFPPQASMVVNSGHGIQAYYLLRDPLLSQEALLLLREWAVTWEFIENKTGYQIDKVFDLPRVMRLPGSINRKTEPVSTGILREDWGIRYSPTELREAFPAPSAVVGRQTSTRRSTKKQTAPTAPTPARAADLERSHALLVAMGCGEESRSEAGDSHYSVPNGSHPIGVTLYLNGNIVVWSETFARTYTLTVQVPYSLLSLRRALVRNGGATEALAAYTSRYPDSGEVPNSGSLPRTLSGPDGFNYTDLGNAKRVLQGYGDEIRFVPTWARFVTYRGGKWSVDNSGSQVMCKVLETANGLKDQLAIVESDVHLSEADAQRAAKAHLAHIRHSENKTGIDGAVRALQGQGEIHISHEDLDANRWLLNVLNGTIDLLDGTLQPHRPSDMLTKMAPIRFVDNATAPRFLTFLAEILPDDDVRRFVQQLMGLSLVGHQLEHILPIAIGSGANGKSTLTNVMASILGDYAVVCSKDLFVATRSPAHRTIVASLFGVRFAHCSELPESVRLNEAQIKELTGGDRITARRMSQDEWNFSPSHIFWLHANTKPTIAGDDEGIWRRVKLIPFDVQIPRERQDSGLASRLVDVEASGILNWALAGLKDYQSVGLTVPAEVEATTEEHRREFDTVAEFLSDEGLEFDSDTRISSSELQSIHKAWHEDHPDDIGQKAHYQRVTNHIKVNGATKKRGNPDVWTGVGMRRSLGHR